MRRPYPLEELHSVRSELRDQKREALLGAVAQADALQQAVSLSRVALQAEMEQQNRVQSAEAERLEQGRGSAADLQRLQGWQGEADHRRESLLSAHRAAKHHHSAQLLAVERAEAEWRAAEAAWVAAVQHREKWVKDQLARERSQEEERVSEAWNARFVQNRAAGRGAQ